jgi:hypothetical protein
MRKLERRSRIPQLRSFAKVFLVSVFCNHLTKFEALAYSFFPEEFSIYLNYVRKLGFEESPDYDFLRDLFTKILKTVGEPEDGIFDWMLLNNGKGWEAANVSF